ncbi:MAG: hypothetical protein WDN46_17675 [Methylocella sp.]
MQCHAQLASKLRTPIAFSKLFPQPHAGPSTILGDEFDAGCFKGDAELSDRSHRTLLRHSRSLNTAFLALMGDRGFLDDDAINSVAATLEHASPQTMGAFGFGPSRA